MQRTDTIPAALGTTFGFFFVPQGKGSVRMRRVVRFPEPGLQPAGLAPERELTRDIDCIAGLTCEALYHFKESYQLAPGTWTIQVLAGERLLHSETYHVVPSNQPVKALPPAPRLEGLKELEASQIPDVFPETATCSEELDARAERYTDLSLDDVTALARAGDMVAENELGRRYGLGLGVPKNPEESFAWYQKGAAQRGCAAEANLAFMYFNGEGVAKDLELAKHWSLSAAMQSSPQAQYALGYMYVTGTGVAKNGPIAERWFLLAAKAGSARARKSLIKMYHDGDGVPRDDLKARYWMYQEKKAMGF
jgi:hypothetical protein